MHTPRHSIVHANYLSLKKDLGMDRSLCYKLWTAFSRSVDEATRFILKSNLSDTGAEHAVLLALRLDIGLWYVSFNSMNVATLF